MNLLKVLLCVILLNFGMATFASDTITAKSKDTVIETGIIKEDILDNTVIDEVQKAEVSEMGANDVMMLTFQEDFDVNKAEKGKEIPLKLESEFQDMDGEFIPAGTMFYGRVDSVTKSRAGYRRAKAKITIDKMILPDGTMYKVKGKPKSGLLASSAGKNFAKGVGSTVLSVGICVTGLVLITGECLSGVGLVFAPATGIVTGIAVSSTTHGTNYKVKAGTKLPIKFVKLVEE